MSQILLRLLRLPAVLEKKGNSRAGTYDEIKAGTFPPPVKLGPRASGWPAHEIDAVIAARIAGRSDDEIRIIVADLVREREKLLARFCVRSTGEAPVSGAGQ